MAARITAEPRTKTTIMDSSDFFPAVDFANEDGLLAVGGELEVAWLLDAYRHGIFPWPTSDGVLTWWSPDPRPVLEFEDFYISRRLRRLCRSGRFEVSCDCDFPGVIEGCATAQDRRQHMWLFPGMRSAYCALHRAGHAHSVEVWQDGELIGGTYGVAVGAAFSAESMFYRQRDASKVALVCLMGHLQACGFQMVDIQQLTPHTERLGATEIPRCRFLRRLKATRDLPVRFASELSVRPENPGL